MRRTFEILAVLLPIAAFFAGCEKKEQINTLEVNPSSTIQFKASGNESVSITVSTDAASWNYTAPDWVTAEKEGNMLSVNVKDNTGSARSGKIVISAGNADNVSVTVYQEEAAEVDYYLNVSPSDAIIFKATGNVPVELTVDTNVPLWSVDVPQWLEVEKTDGKISVNAKDNAGTDQLIGRITVYADNSEAESVKINVLQEGAEADENAAEASIKDSSDGSENITLVIENLDVIKRSLRVSISEVLGANADMEVIFDAEYLDEYNYVNKTDYQLYPASNVSLAAEGKVTVTAGATGSDIELSINPDSYDLRNNVNYLLPLVVRSRSANVVAKDGIRVNYIVSRKCDKAVKNILYFEVNDVNPLNALEYRVEDGSMFFDAVVLFAANINWDGQRQRVYLHQNPNVKALLDNSETYLQPLRKAGIKVLLGVLGNHDPAGLCQLSAWGAEQYAVELANAVKTYRLDGISVDDEYSEDPLTNNKWFTSWSPSAGAKLLYETKKAMTEIVPWETYVQVYQLGGFLNVPSTEGHNPGEFVDIAVADYGLPASTFSGMTKKNCSAMSVELSRDRGNVSAAYGAKDKGYGWFMWFSFNPEKKLEGGVSAFRQACDGLYGMRLIEPTGIYKKVGEGVYDPERYEL